MSQNKFPIPCYLTDKDGHIINPYEPNAIVYRRLGSRCKGRQNNNHSKGIVLERTVKILITGFVAYCMDGRNLSTPVPFRIIKCFTLSEAQYSQLQFELRRFCCCAFINPSSPLQERVDLRIDIETAAISFLSFFFHSKLRFSCKEIMLKGDVYQYNAIADGEKRVYTNKEEVKGYGDRGILSPNESSYHNVFVNAVLQPKVNYKITRGVIEFVTKDVPKKGQPINIVFFSLMGKDGSLMKGENYQYYAISDGKKRVFTDVDMLKEYSDGKIRSKSEVSYYNLYVNGVLQPTVNYRIWKNKLELTTEDLPIKGAAIILEAICLRGMAGELMQTEEVQYNTYGKKEKRYSDSDGIEMYASMEIVSPEQTSYQNVFVNGVIQPGGNYVIQRDGLSLVTEDVPLPRSPITLQSITTTMIESNRVRPVEPVLPRAILLVMLYCYGFC